MLLIGEPEHFRPDVLGANEGLEGGRKEVLQWVPI